MQFQYGMWDNRSGTNPGASVSPFQFYATILAPIAPTLSDSPQARCLLMAIAGHESAWTERIQIPGGQARGFWQCERGGAVNDVMTDPKFLSLCKTICIPTDIDTVFEAIAWNDTLAYWVARRTLWVDPAPLPAIGDVTGSLTYYLRNWRPGKPNVASWSSIYAQVMSVIQP